jgi:hypothetical protein
MGLPSSEKSRASSLRALSITLVSVVLCGSCVAQSVRVPAVPLITHDPYFSIWSMADNLTDDATRHWSGTPQSLIGLIRIDGQTLRWMGAQPEDLPAIKQTALEITPTRTVYRFEEKRVRLAVSFLSPLLASDLDVLSRPITYVAITCSAVDGMKP